MSRLRITQKGRDVRRVAAALAAYVLIGVLALVAGSAALAAITLLARFILQGGVG